MTKFLVSMLVLVACVLAPQTALAESPTNDRATQDEADFFTRTIRVNCDHGGTLNRALKAFGPRLTIEFKGTCTEDLVIRRDDVTLRGSDANATLIGGIQIDGSSRVAISDFLVKDNTQLEGAIEALAGSSVAIHDMVVENSGNRGIRIRDSVADIRDVSIDGSATAGLLTRGSNISLEGNITVTNSAEGGIILTDASSTFSKEGVIVANDNLFGIIVQTSSSFEGVFGSVTADNNQVHGLLVASNGAFNYGVTLQTNGNGFAGIYVDEGSIMSPFANLTSLASTTAIGNGFAGIFVDRNSTFELFGNASIAGQVYGVFISTASVLQMTDTTLAGNFVGDLRFDFGSVGDFSNGGNSVGSVSCTADIITRGDVACP
ncbi:MAG: right-handed parallel beta-helix repeat-containing protein [Acidobacteriota bacterium]